MAAKIRKTIIVLVIAALGLALTAGAAFAEGPECEPPPVEVLYVSDTLGVDDGQTALFRVDLDEAAGAANLILLPNGLLEFNHADTLASTPDGTRLYFIDDGPGPVTEATMGYYDVATASVHTVGVIRLPWNNVTGFDQAAFSPDGVFYATSAQLDRLYALDPVTAQATDLGVVVRAGTTQILDVTGADIAFDAEGTFYLFTNPDSAPKGLYRLALPPENGMVQATYLGQPNDGALYRGIAVRANGYGDIAATTSSNYVRILDKETGEDAIPPLPLFLNGEPFVTAGGDMANGPLTICTRTIGYWKTHDWGRSITILGVPVSQTEGRRVLRNATSENFSMLFAQLIAAKLNVNNSTGLDVIDDAEAWLAEQPGLVNPDGTINWYKAFDTRKQKTVAVKYKDALDQFNNAYHCDNDVDSFEKRVAAPMVTK